MSADSTLDYIQDELQVLAFETALQPEAAIASIEQLVGLVNIQ
jgi:hypothetical protein